MLEMPTEPVPLFENLGLEDEQVEFVSRHGDLPARSSSGFVMAIVPFNFNSAVRPAPLEDAKDDGVGLDATPGAGVWLPDPSSALPMPRASCRS